MVQASEVVPTTEVASTVAYNLAARRNGAPLPVIFPQAAPAADPQVIVEDPRFVDATFCRAVGTIADICAAASAE